MSLKQRSLSWQLGLSAYWFAINLKWFILLSAVLSSQVAGIVPGGEKSTAWGNIVLIGAIWALFGPALFGRLSDRRGAWRPFLALGCAGTVVALFILSSSHSYVQLILGYLLLQVSDDAAQGPYSALIPGLVPPEQRGRASGIMSFLLMAAQLAGGIGAILLQHSLASIYILIGAVNIACALISLAVVREEPERMPAEPTSFAEAWIEPFRSHDFKWVWFTRFLNALGFYCVYTYLRNFLADAVGDFKIFGFDISPVHDGNVADAAFQAVFVLLLLISVIGAVGAVIGGIAADRVGRKRVVYVSGALMATPIIPFVFFHNYTLIVLLAIPFALGYGAYQSADWALASDVMPVTDLAKNMGLWQSCIVAPQIFSGLAGRVVDAGNRAGGNLGYEIVFIIAAVAFAASIILVRNVRGST
jgi:MFS family permease